MYWRGRRIDPANALARAPTRNCRSGSRIVAEPFSARTIFIHLLSSMRFADRRLDQPADLETAPKNQGLLPH
jgi:hypothetical protein